jgi:hypothetical protein
MDANVESLKDEYLLLEPYLNETTLRLWAAARAAFLPHGGIQAVASAVGLSRRTIERGLRELRAGSRRRGAVDIRAAGRVRLPGGGRKKITEVDPGLSDDLDGLVEPKAPGDPTSPLRWTCKSTTRLAAELNQERHRVSQRKLCDLLDQLGYSLQSTRKVREGSQHPDRNAQFEHIAAMVKRFQKAGQPVVSVDTKKKELIGDFANQGREWQPSGKPKGNALRRLRPCGQSRLGERWHRPRHG